MGLSTGKCPDCGENYLILDGVPQHKTCSANQTLMAPPPLEGKFTELNEASKPTAVRKIDDESRTLAATPPVTPGTGPMLPGAGTPRPSGRTVKPGAPDLPADVQLAMQKPENLIANYVLVAQVGKGGMGTVWRAWDRKLARYIALKFLHAQGEADVARFQREAQLAAGLRHPNIAPIYEFGEHKGQWFLAMEFVDGSSLEKSKLPVAEVLDLMIPICLALDYAHQQGVIHRDLKPQNIMLTSNKWAYVMDFGLAKQVEGGTELSAVGSIMGTPSFMPPEQAQGDTAHIDRRSDVYSLGATLYHLLAGGPPFTGKNPMDTMMKVLKEDPPPLRKANPAVPYELEVITMKAMDKDPARRYQSAAELADDLKRFKQGDSISARPPSMRFLMTRAVRRNPWLFISAGLATVAVIAVTAVLIRPKPEPTPVDPQTEVLRRQWLADFRQARAPLSFEEFRAGEDGAKRAEALNGVLKKADEFIRAGDVKDVVQWFRDQAGLGKQVVDAWVATDKKAWVGKRAEAQKLIEWAGDMRKALDGLGNDYAATAALFAPVAESASRVVAYRGTATVRVHVLPYARIESLKAGERFVIRGGKLEDASRATPSDGDLTCPMAILELEIDDYEMELVHPTLGKSVLKLGGMENGREYTVIGEIGKDVLLK